MISLGVRETVVSSAEESDILRKTSQARFTAEASPPFLICLPSAGTCVTGERVPEQKRCAHSLHSLFNLYLASGGQLRQMSAGDSEVTSAANRPMRLRLIGAWLLPDNEVDKRGQ